METDGKGDNTCQQGFCAENLQRGLEEERGKRKRTKNNTGKEAILGEGRKQGKPGRQPRITQAEEANGRNVFLSKCALTQADEPCAGINTRLRLLSLKRKGGHGAMQNDSATCPIPLRSKLAWEYFSDHKTTNGTHCLAASKYLLAAKPRVKLQQRQ